MAFRWALACALFVGGCGDDGRPGDAATGDARTDGAADGAVPDGGADGAVDGGGDGGPIVPPGCGPGPFAEPTITVCPGDAIPSLASGICEVTPGNTSLLITGDVLTPGEVFRGGQLLVDGTGSITCVACDCSGAAGAAGATTIVCPDGVVSPGLINAHDHITFDHASPYSPTAERYEHRHDWGNGRNMHTELFSRGSFSTNEQRSWHELRNVMAGTTSINGGQAPSGFLRNLDQATRQEGLGQPAVDQDAFPFGDNDGEVPPEGSCAYPDMVLTSDIMMFDAFSPHVSEGIDYAARNEFLCMREGTGDLIEPQTSIIHGVGLLAGEVAEMAGEGTALIWSPRTNVALYGDTARVTEHARLGVEIAIGTDWTLTGSMNIGRELKCADSLNRDYMNGFFTDEQLWLMATRNAASALAMDDAIGILATGRVADLAIFDASERADHRAVIDADPDDVTLVLRAGVALYGDAAVVNALPGGAMCDAVPICGVDKRICTSREIGITFAELTAANTDNYGLFFCDVPDDEPSCIPERNADEPLPSPEVSGSNRYSGVLTADDGDGDGLLDTEDNCPCTFNPIRPIDLGAQADFDADGAGDACDVCPLEADATTCRPIDTLDRDGDGVPNDEDNCPDRSNPMQEDRDMDGHGDVCDACPDRSNPGAAACPVTIYEIKDLTDMVAPIGSIVAVMGGIVTATGSNGFFIQVGPTDTGYMGPDRSGVFVFTSTAPTVSRGDRVDISMARVDDFEGQTELASPVVTVTASGVALPPPIDVAAADVATGGTRAAALEGVLVRVSDVTVTDVMPAMAPGEFDVTAGLRVDNALFPMLPLPVLGERFASITGVLVHRDDLSKIAPRDAADLVAGPPVLIGLEPDLSYVRVGRTDVPTIPVPLTVVMSRAVTADTTVTVTSGGAGLGVSDVVVPAGMSRVPVLVDGVTASATPVNVTAMLGGTMFGARVRVLGASEGPTTVTLAPAMDTVTLGEVLSLTATLDLPALAGGATVMLSVDMGGSVPPIVVVPADAIAAPFNFTAGMSPATATVTATFGASTSRSILTVSATPLGELVINEIDYDQPSTDMLEFVELYNSTGTDRSLDGLALVFVNGATTMMEYRRFDLTGETIPAGGFLVVSNAGVTVPAGVREINFPDNILQNGGPDGVALLDTTTGMLVDALSYEGEVTAAVLTGVTGTRRLVEGTATTVVDDGSPSRSLVRLPDGADRDDASMDWAASATPTPGAPNSM